jgi:hypothetical protein
MSKRWDKEEKSVLLKMIAKNKTYEDIGKKLDRTPNAIKLRLENIIYDNILNGATKDIIANELKLKEEDIIQMFYAYKNFLENKGHDTADADNIDIYRRSKVDKKKSKKKLDVSIDVGNNNKIKNYTSKILSQMEKENHIMETIIKNHNLKKELKKIMKTSKLDQNTKKLINQYFI